MQFEQRSHDVDAVGPPADGGKQCTLYEADSLVFYLFEQVEAGAP